ncbi:DMT family transporter [Thiomicrospira sp.]|uniref:DMT family transporter n=1 Tax=Thiomicrospira sp. TaxID=935 RepID=UPI002F9467F7
MTPVLFFQTTFFTLSALVAFAANAVICRWALEAGWIDPVSFTSLRLASGAMMLWLVMSLVWWQKRSSTRPGVEMNQVSKGSWRAAMILFIYAITFSYGYIEISTATGALLLAAVVQLTMIGYALRAGDRLHGAEWVGVALALIGLAYLVYPKLTTPSWWGLVVMCISAYTWALYSLNGRRSKNPLSDTAYNFYRTLPWVAVSSLLFIPFMHLTTEGIILAVFSGAITSGLGYILWYKALPSISSSLASASQLLVPLMAAFGAAWLIAEPITLHFMLAALLMIGGLGLVLWGRHRHRRQSLIRNPM